MTSRISVNTPYRHVKLISAMASEDHNRKHSANGIAIATTATRVRIGRFDAASFFWRLATESGSGRHGGAAPPDRHPPQIKLWLSIVATLIERPSKRDYSTDEISDWVRSSSVRGDHQSGQ